MAYTLLIADDEPLERNALASLAERVAPGSPEIVLAASGTEVVRIAHQRRIDAAILDIKMPGVSGLDAAAELRSVYPDVDIVLLTAFDYFEYAQRAVRLGAFDYLVKPVEDETVERLLIRLAEANSGTSHSVASLEEARRFVETELFDDIVSASSDADRVKTALDLLGIADDSGYIAIAKFDFSHYPFTLETAAQKRTVVARFLRALKAELGQTFRSVLSRAYPGEGYVLTLGEDVAASDVLSTAAVGAGRQSGCAGIFVLCPISDAPTKLNDTCASLRTYLRTLEFSPEPAILVKHLADAREADSQLGFDTLRQEQALLTAVIDRDPEAAASAAREFYRQYAARVPLAELTERCRTLVVFLGQTLRLRTRDTASWRHLYLDDAYPSLQSLQGEFFAAVQTLASRGSESFEEPLGRKMHDYLVANLTQAVALADLAAFCGISTGHCSRTFKRVFGESFSVYLSRLRINHAKKLLTTTDRNIGRIADDVGFRDPAYFAHVFAKIEGVRPKEYRNAHRPA